MGFNLLFPSLAVSFPWNMQTKGDIIESILGYSYYKNVRMRHIHFAFRSASQYMADLFDEVFFNLYELWQKFGDTPFMECMAEVQKTPSPSPPSSREQPRPKYLLPRIN